MTEERDNADEPKKPKRKQPLGMRIKNAALMVKHDEIIIGNFSGRGNRC